MFTPRRLQWVKFKKLLWVLSSFFLRPKVILFSLSGRQLAEVWKRLTGWFLFHTNVIFFDLQLQQDFGHFTVATVDVLEIPPDCNCINTARIWWVFNLKHVSMMSDFISKVQGSDQEEHDWLWLCRLDGGLWRVHAHGGHHQICRQVENPVDDIVFLGM